MNVNPDVDGWFAHKELVQAEAMLRVREIILGADPRVMRFADVGEVEEGRADLEEVIRAWREMRDRA